MFILVPDNVIVICKTLRAAGFEAYVVGGAVRDYLLGRDAHDWDITTNARPENVVGLFDHVIETGIQHGTVTVVLDDESFEVTTYRTDGTYSDGRHPDEVKFVQSIDDDLSRRDFTINAIAYDPIDERLYDPFAGMCDIRAGLIRAVGSAGNRFREDGLRMLRALRFCSTLGFDLDEDTEAAITDDVPLNVAPERIHDEICKAIMGWHPNRFFRALDTTGLLKRVLPEMLPMIGCAQNKYHEFDVWTHTMHVLAATKSSIHLRIAALFHDVAKPQTKGINQLTGEVTFYDHENVGAELTDAIMARLKFSNEDRKAVTHLVRNHLVIYDKGWSASAIRRWVRKVGADNVDNVIALAKADAVGKGCAKVQIGVAHLSEFKNRILKLNVEQIVTSTTQLAIDGNDVMNVLNVKPGRGIGEALRMLLEVVTEYPELNTREKLLEILESR